MNLAALCDNYVGLKMASSDAIFSFDGVLACHLVAPHHSPPSTPI